MNKWIIDDCDICFSPGMINVKVGNSIIVNADEYSFKAALYGTEIVGMVKPDDTTILCLAGKHGQVVNFHSDGRVEMFGSPRMVGNYIGHVTEKFIRDNDTIIFKIKEHTLEITKDYVVKWTGETLAELAEAFEIAKDYKRLLPLR